MNQETQRLPDEKSALSPSSGVGTGALAMYELALSTTD